ncbi:MAG: ADP-ribosylglycohydrolase family protein [Polyangiales bacterium]
MEPTPRARVRGAVIAAAIGDALGAPVEFIASLAEIRARFGPQGVSGYVHFRERDGRRFAPYTDDTQLSEATLRALLNTGGRDLDATMVELAREYVTWSKAPQGGHRAPGQACLRGCRMLAAGTPWYEAGEPDAGGCGSVMRVFPIGLLHAHDLQRAEDWAVAQSKLTHRAPIALAACAAMTRAIAQTMRGAGVAVATADAMAAAGRYDLATARMLERARDDAHAGVPPEVALERLQGWAADEAIAAAVYVVTRHANDLRGGLLEAANTPGDSDSIASLVGAWLGTLLGFDAVPHAWIDPLERSSELLALADRAADTLA